jgi:DNA-directed RNA polymerase specialized sigma24 family protein
MSDASPSLAKDLGEPEPAHLSPEEVVERIDSLTADELQRLWIIERRRIDGTDFGERMLFQEAVCQAILGERRCPRDVSFVAFLAQSMRSVASHRRERLSRQVPANDDAVPQRRAGVSLTTDQLDPEQTLIEREADDIVKVMTDLLEGDDEAQLTIMAIVDGKKGKELRDELGIDQPRFDYIMKRIKRAAAKEYPKGWPV